MPSEQTPRRLIRPFLLSMLAAIVFYGLAVAASDLSEIAGAIARLSFATWVIVLSLSLVNYGLRFGRWQIYLKTLGHHVPSVSSLAYYLGGFAFTTTPGKAGEAVRSVYLRPHGVSYMHSIGALFAERLVDLLVMLLLALGAVVVFPESRIYAAVLGSVTVLLIFVIHSPSFRQILAGKAWRLPSASVRTITERFANLLDAASQLLRTPALLVGLGIGLVAWAAEGVALHRILIELDAPLPVSLVVGIYAISILTGAVSFIPGGLGSTETAMALLLALSGTDMVTAVAATLICRLATLWFAIAIGIFVLAGLEVRGWYGRGAANTKNAGA